MDQHITQLLEKRGIKPTAMRTLVLRCLLNAESTLTLRDLEDALYPADRSTIFRTLLLFEEHHLLHSIDDGSGSARYEICHSHHHDTFDDRHPHFRCIQCKRTICLTDIQVPIISLPEGFQAHQVNYVITGICNQCSDKVS